MDYRDDRYSQQPERKYSFGRRPDLQDNDKRRHPATDYNDDRYLKTEKRPSYDRRQ